MISSIIKILVGLFIWKVAPRLIEFGDKKMKSFVQISLNVIGVIIVIMGVLSLLSWLF